MILKWLLDHTHGQPLDLINYDFKTRKSMQVVYLMDEGEWVLIGK